MNGRPLPTATRSLCLVVLLFAPDAFSEYSAARKKALQRAEAEQHEEALTAFRELARTARNDIQRSDALEQAALLAQRLSREEEALELAAQIPHLPHAKTVRMRLLAHRELWSALLAEFKDDDFGGWPGSLAGEAFYLRGKAYLQAKDLPAAQRDLAQAARRRKRAEVFFDLAGVCMALNRDVEAMDAYRNVQRALPTSAGWMFLTAVTARARILNRHGKYAYALEELDKADGTTGYWRVQCLKLRAAALAGMGQTAAAATVYRQALAVPGIYDVQRNDIEAELQSLSPQTGTDRGE